MNPEPVLNKALFLNNPEQSFKEYERLRLWYINALARIQRAEKERERWHGKYMMVKHENNALRSAVYDIAAQYQVITECPNCQHLQRIVISFGRKTYYCEECATKFALNFSDPPANRRMHLIYFAAVQQ